MEELLLETPCGQYERPDEWYAPHVDEDDAIRLFVREMYGERQGPSGSEILNRRDRALYWRPGQWRYRRYPRKMRAIAVDVNSVFEQLASKWKRETRHMSSITRTAMHPAYQSIIGMGEIAVPLILRELAEHGGHWLWALKAITRQDPAPERSNFDEAVRAWLEWGRSHGYI
jgi:hypothetical protein